MEAEKFIYYTLVIFLIVGFAAGVGFSLYTEEEPEEINHSERFDRIENEIVNFGVDYSDRFDRIENLGVEYLVNGQDQLLKSTAMAINLTVKLAGSDQVIPISFTVSKR